jgi:hypothetical protein
MILRSPRRIHPFLCKDCGGIDGVESFISLSASQRWPHGLRSFVPIGCALPPASHPQRRNRGAPITLFDATAVSRHRNRRANCSHRTGTCHLRKKGAVVRERRVRSARNTTSNSSVVTFRLGHCSFSLRRFASRFRLGSRHKALVRIKTPTRRERARGLVVHCAMPWARFRSVVFKSQIGREVGNLLSTSNVVLDSYL